MQADIIRLLINPLTARIFTVFGQFIRGQSVTQRSMGREAPQYILVHKKVKFSRRDISLLAIKGLKKNMKIVKKHHTQFDSIAMKKKIYFLCLLARILIQTIFIYTHEIYFS